MKTFIRNVRWKVCGVRWNIKRILLLCVLSCTFSVAQSKEVPFTMEDRDRIMQANERMESMQKEMNVRFESMQKEMDTRFASMDTRFESMNTRFEEMNTRFEEMNDKINKLYTLIYFVLGGVFGLIGLIMWDRRSYIKPVKEDITDLQNALKEYAKEQPKLADILRSHGL